MKIYFVIGAVVVVILISVYIFMEKQNPKEPITMSGYFEIDPIIGMLGRRGLYFFEESENGMAYQVVSGQVVEISGTIKDGARLRVNVTGTVKTIRIKEPVLGETDQFTGEYKKIKRYVLELISYRQI